MKFYGTLGPACADVQTLKAMFQAGMTGLRLNTSHIKLEDAMEWLLAADEAARKAGCSWELLADLKGPEVRIGALKEPLVLKEGETVTFGTEGTDCMVTVQEVLMNCIRPGQILWLDDSLLKLRVTKTECCDGRFEAAVLTGGILKSSKSLAVEGVEIPSATLTETDLENLSFAGSELKRRGLHLTAVMQPFVRNQQDLMNVRKALDENGLSDVRIMAKIENEKGVNGLESLLPYCDEIIIARGDLGTAVTLPKLPVVQRRIEEICHLADKPYMVVTQMLYSMMESPVPTRAEVSDIAGAVFGGASSIMLTGETASGKYPVKSMEVFIQTAHEALSYMDISKSNGKKTGIV